MRALGLLLRLGLLVLWAGPAAAHASLIESHPADGVVLDAAPACFELRFNEPVAPLVLRLVSADGTTTTLDRYRIDGTALVVEAPAVGRGSHALSWRVVSEDGHPIGGSILFSVGAPSAGGTSLATTTTGRAVQAAIWSAKVALYVGLFIGVGGVCFGAFVVPLPRAAHGVCIVVLPLGLAAAAVSVGLQGLDALGTSMEHLVEGKVWRAGLATSYGATAILAIGAMAASLIALALRSPVLSQALAVTALIGTGVALAASGHASAAAPQLLMRPAVFLHVVGIALWTGALLPLAAILHARRADTAPALSRFSRAIPFVLVPLVAAGLVLAAVQLGHPSALWSTAYGNVLLAKLALVLVLLVLAGVNRWRLTKPAVAGEKRATRLLARSVAAEIALALAILGVCAAWRFTPPPRALDSAARPAAVHLHAEQAMAHLTITPGRAGPVSASIRVMTGDSQPLEAQEVTLVLANPAAGIEPIRRPAMRAADGSWRVDKLILPVAGRWSIRLDVLVSDFEQIRLEAEVEIDAAP